MLQDCFDHVDWDMFRVASENNVDVYTNTVTELIRKCIGDVVRTVTIKTYPKQEAWIDGSICAMHASNSIMKFADDTKVVGLITNNDETAYMEEVRVLAE
jgi:hypothetical protein